jgi:dihydroorotase
MTYNITLTRPDDWHLHLRDGVLMRDVVPDTAKRFARAIVMPNLKPPITTLQAAIDYRQRIVDAVPKGMTFEPLMTLYLTDNMLPAEITQAKASGLVHAVKYYPAGATTNSDSGVTAIEKTYEVLDAMQQHGMPLLLHGEVTDTSVDIFDREKVFIDTILSPLVKKFPALRIVLEHITTSHAAEFVLAAGNNIAATITAHHLLLNRNAIFQGGIRPHNYCLPVLKRETHRLALIKAATSGNPKFFLGTDSAPHAKHTKENACGCAGLYTSHAGIELYAEAFDIVNAIDKLEGFASFFGADFYRLPRNTEKIALEKMVWNVPAEIKFGDDKLVPMRAGETVQWKLAS